MRVVGPVRGQSCRKAGLNCKASFSTRTPGPFETRYHAILKTTFDPPLGAISHMGANIDGKYLGPDCPADDKK